jgi:hypothetical protein
VIAVMEFVLGQQAALQAVDHGKDLSIRHYFTFASKEKRPPANASGRDLMFVSQSIVTGY